MPDGSITLRPVERGDLEFFFANQADPATSAMAAVPVRERAEFDAHWSRILADASVAVRTIVVSDAMSQRVAGNVACFGPSDEREVAYVIDRALWGRGIATTALRAFVVEVDERPLFGRVAEHNVASARVLEHCGFVQIGRERASDGVNEVIYALEAAGRTR
jgi:RimJ/RimL family protein N-acetyltransferase